MFGLTTLCGVQRNGAFAHGRKSGIGALRLVVARGRRPARVVAVGTARKYVPVGLREKHPCFSRSRRQLLARAFAFFGVALGVGSLALSVEVTPLDKFLDGLKTLRASFTQTLVDSGGRVVDKASGSLVVQRPGKFRWETKPQSGKGGEQLLVADGKNVWFFDRELEQVTVKPADAALSATPAMLLSAAGEVREKFTVTSAGARDGLDWVLVEPKAAEADFRRALLGFGKSGLERMIVDDKLGQTATVVFDGVTRNGAVAPDEVKFSTPAGVDVIGTPAG